MTDNRLLNTEAIVLDSKGSIVLKQKNTINRSINQRIKSQTRTILCEICKW